VNIQFDKRITLGNVLTLVSTMIMVGAAWGMMKADISTHQKSIDRLEIMDAALKLEIGQVRERSDNRTESLIKEMGAVREALSSINTNVQWLREQAMKDPKKSP
jgi:hypothetical protein